MVGRATSIRAVKELITLKLVRKLERRGGSNRYLILPLSSTTRDTTEAEVVPPETRGSISLGTRTVPPETHEGYPSKVIQIREEIERECEREKEADEDSLRSFSLPHGKEFEAAWTDWTQHLIEMERPLDPETSASFLRRLGNYEEAEAVATIQFSIEEGGTGLRYAAPAPSPNDRASI